MCVRFFCFFLLICQHFLLYYQLSEFSFKGTDAVAYKICKVLFCKVVMFFCFFFRRLQPLSWEQLSSQCQVYQRRIYIYLSVFARFSWQWCAMWPSREICWCRGIQSSEEWKRYIIPNVFVWYKVTKYIDEFFFIFSWLGRVNFIKIVRLF